MKTLPLLNVQILWGGHALMYKETQVLLSDSCKEFGV